MTEEEIARQAELYGQIAEETAQSGRPHAEKMTRLVLQRHGVSQPPEDLVHELVNLMLLSVKLGAKAMIHPSLRIQEKGLKNSIPLKDHFMVIANLMLENGFISDNALKLYLAIAQRQYDESELIDALQTVEEMDDAIQELSNLHMIKPIEKGNDR